MHTERFRERGRLTTAVALMAGLVMIVAGLPAVAWHEAPRKDAVGVVHTNLAPYSTYIAFSPYVGLGGHGSPEPACPAHLQHAGAPRTESRYPGLIYVPPVGPLPILPDTGPIPEPTGCLGNSLEGHARIGASTFHLLGVHHAELSWRGGGFPVRVGPGNDWSYVCAYPLSLKALQSGVLGPFQHPPVGTERPSGPGNLLPNKVQNYDRGPCIPLEEDFDFDGVDHVTGFGRLATFERGIPTQERYSGSSHPIWSLFQFCFHVWVYDRGVFHLATDYTFAWVDGLRNDWGSGVPERQLALELNPLNWDYGWADEGGRNQAC